MPTIRKPLPAFYYYSFWLAEPLLLSIPATLMVFLDGNGFTDGSLTMGVEKATEGLGNTVRGKLLNQTLGIFFFISAANALTLYPIIKKQLAHLPEVQQSLVTALQGALFIADAVMLFVNMYNLPSSVLSDTSKWTLNIWSHAIIDPTLVIIRGAWLLGIGRPFIVLAPKVK